MRVTHSSHTQKIYSQISLALNGIPSLGRVLRLFPLVLLMFANMVPRGGALTEDQARLDQIFENYKSDNENAHQKALEVCDLVREVETSLQFLASMTTEFHDKNYLTYDEAKHIKSGFRELRSAIIHTGAACLEKLLQPIHEVDKAMRHMPSDGEIYAKCETDFDAVEEAMPSNRFIESANAYLEQLGIYHNGLSIGILNKIKEFSDKGLSFIQGRVAVNGTLPDKGRLALAKSTMSSNFKYAQKDAIELRLKLERAREASFAFWLACARVADPDIDRKMIATRLGMYDPEFTKDIFRQMQGLDGA